MRRSTATCVLRPGGLAPCGLCRCCVCAARRCKAFTPQLIQMYSKLKIADGKNLEIVLVSADRSQEAFDAYFGKMPWLAVDFAGLSLSPILVPREAGQSPLGARARLTYACVPADPFIQVPAAMLIVAPACIPCTRLASVADSNGSQMPRLARPCRRQLVCRESRCSPSSMKRYVCARGGSSIAPAPPAADPIALSIGQVMVCQPAPSRLLSLYAGSRATQTDLRASLCRCCERPHPTHSRTTLPHLSPFKHN